MQGPEAAGVGAVVDASLGPGGIEPSDSFQGCRSKALRSFRKAAGWPSAAKLKLDCEAYFDRVAERNAKVARALAWRPTKAEPEMPEALRGLDAEGFEKPTHTGLALRLKLPSRAALQAFAARGPEWQDVLDWVDLSIEKAMVDGMLSSGGRFSRSGCQAYLERLLSWRPDQRQAGADMRGAKIVVINSPEAARDFAGMKAALDS